MKNVLVFLLRVCVFFFFFPQSVYNFFTGNQNFHTIGYNRCNDGRIICSVFVVVSVKIGKNYNSDDGSFIIFDFFFLLVTRSKNLSRLFNCG